MPYSINVDHVRRRVVVVSHDPVGLADALQLLDRFVAEGVWTYSLLHDARAITWIPSVPDIRRLLSHIEAITRTRGPRGPVALITANDALFGMTRMYSVLGQDIALTVEVFRDPLQAERWLDDQFPHQV
jgi:hypothetical protein